MPNALAEICGLTVAYTPTRGKPILAVDDVSLSIAPGEIVGVLGESGSGKSTLAAAFMRLLPANACASGTIQFEDNEILALPESELGLIRGKRIAMVPQDPALALNPVMRVGAHISEVLRAHLPLKRSDRKRRVEELLREAGFNDAERIARSYPHQLSGGERQRVVIAQAISCRPALIIADEPISKLDTPLQLEILNLMSETNRRHGTALLWITHDPATLADFAQRVAVMHAGRIVEEGHTREILQRPQHSYSRTLMHAARELALGLPSDRNRSQYVH